MNVNSYRWVDNRWANFFAKNRRMKRKIKFGFSLFAAIIQYCVEKREGKEVISKREFVRKFYKKYLDLSNSTISSDQGKKFNPRCDPFCNLIFKVYNEVNIIFSWTHYRDPSV